MSEEDFPDVHVFNLHTTSDNLRFLNMNRIAGCPWKFGSVLGKTPLKMSGIDSFTVKIIYLGRGI